MCTQAQVSRTWFLPAVRPHTPTDPVRSGSPGSSNRGRVVSPRFESGLLCQLAEGLWLSPISTLAFSFLTRGMKVFCVCFSVGMMEATENPARTGFGDRQPGPQPPHHGSPADTLPAPSRHPVRAATGPAACGSARNFPSVSFSPAVFSLGMSSQHSRMQTLHRRLWIFGRSVNTESRIPWEWQRPPPGRPQAAPPHPCCGHNPPSSRSSGLGFWP